jgi:hypothetical protein
MISSGILIDNQITFRHRETRTCMISSSNLIDMQITLNIEKQ